MESYWNGRGFAETAIGVGDAIGGFDMLCG